MPTRATPRVGAVPLSYWMRCCPARRLEMAIDEKLATHVRAALADASPVREVRMFGGIGFMLNGNMIAATSDRGLLVRVGEQGAAEALARPGAEPMIMNGRTMKGYVRIAAALDS